MMCLLQDTRKHSVPPRGFIPLIWPYFILLMLSTAIGLFGCSDDNDNARARDVENRTFIFDSSFIDHDIPGLTTILDFGAAIDEDRVPFTLSLRDAATGIDEVSVSDIATVSSIELPIGVIELRDETLPDPLVFDVHVHEEDDGTLEFTFTNERGDDLHFEFKIGEMSAVASPR